MRARVVAAFVLGLALGALCLGVFLWRSGGLVAAVPSWKTAPAPVAVNLNDLLADIGKQAPPQLPPPVMDPLDYSQPSPAAPAAPGEPVPDSESVFVGPRLPAATPAPSGEPAPGGQPPFIGPRAPAVRGESDRIAPDVTGLPHLAMPFSGIDPKKLADNFSDARSAHKHEALDIMAPRGTPVLAVAQGNVAKLFTSKQGGFTVYQFDDSRTYCYYYAHLDRYAPGIQEGTLLRRGEVLGYVGSTGNASPASPHLHFAVFKLGPEKKWWEGTAIDPLPMFK